MIRTLSGVPVVRRGLSTTIKSIRRSLIPPVNPLGNKYPEDIPGGIYTGGHPWWHILHRPPPRLFPLRLSPIRPPPLASPVGTMPATPYTITDRDEYGVGYAALTFDSPQHARDYLLGLLSATDNTATELALQAELEEVEAVLDAEAG